VPAGVWAKFQRFFFNLQCCMMDRLPSLIVCCHHLLQVEVSGIWSLSLESAYSVGIEKEP